MDDVILTLIDMIEDVPDKDLILIDKQLLSIIGEKFVQKDIYNDGYYLGK